MARIGAAAVVRVVVIVQAPWGDGGDGVATSRYHTHGLHGFFRRLLRRAMERLGQVLLGLAFGGLLSQWKGDQWKGVRLGFGWKGVRLGFVALENLTRPLSGLTEALEVGMLGAIAG